MRSRMWLAAVGVAVIGAAAAGQGQQKKHLNPMIELHVQKKPIFGLYAPTNPRGRGNRGGAPARRAPRRRSRLRRRHRSLKTPAELAKDALAYEKSDFVFDGSMERRRRSRHRPVHRARQRARRRRDAGGALAPSAVGEDARRSRPIPPRRSTNISRQLNLGVSTIVFVDVESADEVKQGLAAMRFKSKGGTRPDDVGSAPAYWGM